LQPSPESSIVVIIIVVNHHRHHQHHWNRRHRRKLEWKQHINFRNRFPQRKWRTQHRFSSTTFFFLIFVNNLTILWLGLHINENHLCNPKNYSLFFMFI
jgi:hypothetical protein